MVFELLYHSGIICIPKIDPLIFKPLFQVKKGPPPKVVAKPSPQEDTDEAAALEKFALELRWCLQQIELSMEKKQGNSKQSKIEAHIMCFGDE